MNNGDAGAEAIGLVFMLLMIAVGLAIQIFVCWLLYRANDALPVQHRKVESGLAFLLLIPLVNLFWNFFLYARISRGMQSYFQSKNDASVGDCGESMGMWIGICAILCAPVYLVLVIVYLVKISGLRTRVLVG